MGFVKILQLGRFINFEKQVVADIIPLFVQRVKPSKQMFILVFARYITHQVMWPYPASQQRLSYGCP